MTKNFQDYLAGLEPAQRQEIERLDALIRSWHPELETDMWNSMGRQIIGYGRTTYRLANGRVNQWFIIGLAAHKSYLSLYIWGILNGSYLTELYGRRLGKVRVGKSCLNFKSCADLNLTILQEATGRAIALNRRE